MASEATGKATNGSGPATNGKAYPIEDHTYDVVVVGAGGAGLRAGVLWKPSADWSFGANPCRVGWNLNPFTPNSSTS